MMMMYKMSEKSPRGTVVNVIDGDIEVSVFELQSYNYIPFRTNIIGKDMNLLFHSTMV